MPSKEEIERLVKSFGKHSEVGYVLQGLEDRCKEKYGKQVLALGFGSMDSTTYQWEYWTNLGSQKLLNFWKPLGLTKPLQQIIEECKWEMMECLDHGCKCGHFPLRNNQCSYKATPKDPSVKALFEFLLSIFPSNPSAPRGSGKNQ